MPHEGRPPVPWRAPEGRRFDPPNVERRGGWHQALLCGADPAWNVRLPCHPPPAGSREDSRPGAFSRERASYVNPGPSPSIPNIPFVNRDLVQLAQPAELILKRPFPVVHFLILNVGNQFRLLGLTH
jgi:hypothetical protein